MTRAAALVLVMSAALTGLSCTAGTDSNPSPRVATFLSQPTVAVLQGVTRVETFRLTRNAAAAGQPSLGGYAVTATGAEQGEAFARRLADVLLDEHTYLFDSAKGCIFDPGVGYRVWRGEDVVEVVICFSCDELLVLSPKGTDGSIHRAAEDFDPARGKLVALAKEAFPADPEVQSLNEQR